MIEREVININGEKVGVANLKESVFAYPVKRHLLYEVVKMQLARRRTGTAKTKERGEVRGSTAKIYRQKGTGRARHGQIRANIFVGGGTAFGPRLRDYGYKLPRKMRLNGLKSALSMKVSEGRIRIVNGIEVPEPRTKCMVEVLNKMGVTDCLLVVDSEGLDRNLRLAARNLPRVKVVDAMQLSVYDLMLYDYLVLTVGAVEQLHNRLSS